MKIFTNFFSLLFLISSVIASKNKTDGKSSKTVSSKILKPAVFGALGLAGAAGIGYAIKKKIKEDDYADIVFLDDTPIGYGYFNHASIPIDPGRNYHDVPGLSSTPIHDNKSKKWKKSLRSFFSKIFNKENGNHGNAPNYPEAAFGPQFHDPYHQQPPFHTEPFPRYLENFPHQNFPQHVVNEPRPLNTHVPVPFSVEANTQNFGHNEVHQHNTESYGSPFFNGRGTEFPKHNQPEHSQIIPFDTGNKVEHEERFPTIFRVKPSSTNDNIPEKNQFLPQDHGFTNSVEFPARHPNPAINNIDNNFDSGFVNQIPPPDILFPPNPTVHQQFFPGNQPHSFSNIPNPGPIFDKKPIDNSFVFVQEKPINKIPVNNGQGFRNTFVPGPNDATNHHNSLLPVLAPGPPLKHGFPIEPTHRPGGYAPPLLGKQPQNNVLFHSNSQSYLPPFGQLPLEHRPRKRKANDSSSSETNVTTGSPITNIPFTTPFITPRPSPGRKRRNSTLKNETFEANTDLLKTALTEIELKDSYGCAQLLLCFLAKLPEEQLSSEESALLETIKSDSFRARKFLLAIEWARMASAIRCNQLYPACPTNPGEMRDVMKESIKTL